MTSIKKPFQEIRSHSRSVRFDARRATAAGCQIAALPHQGALLSSPFLLRAIFAGLVQSLLFSAFFFNCAGCASPGSSEPTARSSEDSTNALRLYDPGDDVLLEKESTVEGASGTSSASQAASSQGAWSIALATVTGSDHKALARSLSDQIRDRYPDLTPLFVDNLTGGSASAVFVGHFKSPSSKASQEMMKRIGTLTFQNGAKSFPRAMPARPASYQNIALAPNDLRSLRSRHRVGRIAYSLKIAQWGTFGDDELSYDACRKQAEAMAASLRSRGLNAWFNHNEAREMSVVSVGVFGSNAYDSRSTLYAPEVEVLLERFPTLMINGEPILHPKTGQPLRPVLIEVPK